LRGTTKKGRKPIRELVNSTKDKAERNLVFRKLLALISVLMVLGIGSSSSAQTSPDTASTSDFRPLLEVEPYYQPGSPEAIKVLQDLKDVALGIQPADVFIKTGQAYNTSTLTWLDDWGFGVKHGKIAWSGPYSEWKGEAGSVVDATEYSVIPGMCNPHHHLESMHQDITLVPEVLWPLGETCEFEASHELGNVFGPEANVAYWLKGWEVGLRVYPLPPTAAPPSWAEWTVVEPGAYDSTVWAELFADARVAGSDELMDLPNLLDAKMPGYADMWVNKVASVMQADRPVEGHIMSATEWGPLSAVASSLWSNHENGAEGVYGSPLSAGEIALRKLQLGVDLLLRGEDDVAAILPYLLNKGVDLRRISIATDDRSIEDQLNPEMGGMNYNLRQALAAGAKLEEALAMATINPATHFRKEREVGCLNPGCYADMVMLAGDPTTVNVAETYVGGQLVAKDGQLAVTMPEPDMSSFLYDSVDFGRPLVAEDFTIKGPTDQTTGVAKVLGPFYFGKAMTEEVSLQDGVVVLTDEQKQRLAVWSLADRYHGIDGIVSGATNILYKEYGPLTPETAICMTEAHDSHVAQAIHNSPAAAALCMNTLKDISGGYALVSGGEVLAVVPLNVGGLLSTANPSELAKQFRDYWTAVDSLQWMGGDAGAAAMRSMRFIPLTCDPWVDQATAISKYAPTGLTDMTTMESIPIVE
jgi:adenine deaminase